MVTIKKYGNRRLYDSSSSRYINLDDLARIIREGEQVQVLDARTNEDLTRTVLLQVLMETQGGFNGFPEGFLHRIIRYGGESPWSKALMQQLSLGLEMLDAQISQVESRFSPMRPPTSREDRPTRESRPPEPEPEEAPPRPAATQQDEMSALRERLAALEKKLRR